jgi:hypothetical protein
MDRSAFAVEAIAEACRGVIVVDRRKTSDRLKSDDRPEQELGIAQEEDAA